MTERQEERKKTNWFKRGVNLSVLLVPAIPDSELGYKILNIQKIVWGNFFVEVMQAMPQAYPQKRVNATPWVEFKNARYFVIVPRACNP